LHPGSLSQEQLVKPDHLDPSEPIHREPIPPELVEWARQTFDEDEFLDRLHEMEAGGGSQLEDFLPGVKARARS